MVFIWDRFGNGGQVLNRHNLNDNTFLTAKRTTSQLLMVDQTLAWRAAPRESHVAIRRVPIAEPAFALQQTRLNDGLKLAATATSEKLLLAESRVETRNMAQVPDLRLGAAVTERAGLGGEASGFRYLFRQKDWAVGSIAQPQAAGTIALIQAARVFGDTALRPGIGSPNGPLTLNGKAQPGTGHLLELPVTSALGPRHSHVEINRCHLTREGLQLNHSETNQARFAATWIGEQRSRFRQTVETEQTQPHGFYLNQQSLNRNRLKPNEGSFPLMRLSSQSLNRAGLPNIEANLTRKIHNKYISSAVEAEPRQAINQLTQTQWPPETPN